jgi:hypothetical protein
LGLKLKIKINQFYLFHHFYLLSLSLNELSLQESMHERPIIVQENKKAPLSCHGEGMARLGSSRPPEIQEALT